MGVIEYHNAPRFGGEAIAALVFLFVASFCWTVHVIRTM